MTWVGHPGVVAVGKYRGKGMRLDYFMVEAAIAGRIDVCEQATDGTGVGPLAERPDAAFFGSDHCAVYMRLKEEEEVVGGGGGGERRGPAARAHQLCRRLLAQVTKVLALLRIATTYINAKCCDRYPSSHDCPPLAAAAFSAIAAARCTARGGIPTTCPGPAPVVIAAAISRLISMALLDMRSLGRVLSR